MTESLIITPKFKDWLYLQPDDSVVNTLVNGLKLHPTICRLLALRGVKNTEEAKHFLNPSLNDLINPFCMKDMEKAIERIHRAIADNEKILIYGDYDVDGITSVSLLYTFFKGIHDAVMYYVPDRNKEGCGISYDGIDIAHKESCKLLIALDCGIKDYKKINYAKEKGVDIIICDHHLTEDILPDAYAILNPKRADCTYPFKELSACGVGFKLAQGYTEKYQLDKGKLFELLDFVAVSIAADTVPLLGENRVMAFFGMTHINNRQRVGFKALLDIVRAKRKLNLMDLVFTISPRINAAGRILHASYAVELLIETDYKSAKEKAKVIHDNNYERQLLDKDVTASALELIAKDKNFSGKSSIVLYQPDWHAGVIAITASRLVEKYHKPTIILTDSNDVVVGSGRAPAGFDLYESVESCKDLLTQFGGHKYAVGLRIEKERIQQFIKSFEEAAKLNMLKQASKSVIEIDDVIELTDLNENFYNQIERLAPFGFGNNRPTFATKEVRDTGENGFVGKSHLKLRVTKPGQPARSGIGYDMWDYIPYLRTKKSFDICYQIHLNEWKDQKRVEMKVKDLK